MPSNGIDFSDKSKFFSLRVAPFEMGDRYLQITAMSLRSISVHLKINMINSAQVVSLRRVASVAYANNLFA